MIIETENLRKLYRTDVVETTDEQAPAGDDEAATAPRVKWSA